MCIAYNTLYLVCDLNARTAATQDYIEADPFLLDYFDIDDVLLEHFNRPNVSEMCNLLPNRKTLDTHQNKLGEKTTFYLQK